MLSSEQFNFFADNNNFSGEANFWKIFSLTKSSQMLAMIWAKAEENGSWDLAHKWKKQVFDKRMNTCLFSATCRVAGGGGWVGEGGDGAKSFCIRYIFCRLAIRLDTTHFFLVQKIIKAKIKNLMRFFLKCRRKWKSVMSRRSASQSPTWCATQSWRR
jgi:hypothetical protein